MADVLKPDDAFAYAKTMVKDMRLADIKHRLLDDVSKMLWMAAPWRWTVGALSVVTLANDTQDYTIASFPSDFFYLVNVRLDDGKSPRDLNVVPIIAADTTTKGRPERVSYVASDKYRVAPVPTDYSTAPKLIGIYKKTQTLIDATTTTQAGKSGVPDEWFWVYQEIVLAKSYQYADDQRAGGAKVAVDGQIEYAGQWGIAMAALAEMRRAEKKFLDAVGGEVDRG